MTITRFESNEFMSQAVAHNGCVYVSGQVADDFSLSIEEQTRQALNKIKAQLEAAGSNVGNLLSTTVYLNDIRNFTRMNNVWKDWFGAENMPTRATVEARLAVPGMEVEIVVVAATA